MGKVSKAQQQATAKYKAKAYDRLETLLPKGQKSIIQAAAESEGLSVNEFTKKALLAYLGLDEWPKAEEDE